MSTSRRGAVFGLVLGFACVVGLLAGCTVGGASPATPPATDATATAQAADAAEIQSSDPEKAEAVIQIVRDYMEEAHLKAVIVRVTVDGEEIVTAAEGESMTGVPATTDMHFRNGAVAISYMSTLMLQLVDEKKMTLDDKLSMYLPDLPHADEVTLGQLAQMTSGYQDFVLGNDEFAQVAYSDVFKAWTTEDQIALAMDKPLWFEPGTNWAYAHTNYVILGLVLEEVTGMPLEDALQEKVLDPLGLDETRRPSPPRSPSRRCTPTARSGGRSSASPRERRSTRTRRHGIRRGPSPKAPSRPATSTTCTTARSRSARASCCRPSRTPR